MSRHAVRPLQEVEAATLFGSLAAETILASGVKAAQTGRTHGRKQPDRNSAANTCKPGATHMDWSIEAGDCTGMINRHRQRQREHGAGKGIGAAVRRW